MRGLVLSVAAGFMLMSVSAEARSRSGANDARTVTMDQSVRLKNCGGRMRLAPEQRLRVSYEGIEHCSNLEIPEIGVREKLDGDNGARSGTFDYKLANTHRTKLKFYSNSGAHQDTIDLASAASGRELRLASCGGKVKVSPVAHVNISLEQVSSCSRLEVKGHAYEFTRSGEVSVPAKDLLREPTIKVSDRRSFLATSDEFKFAKSEKREERSNRGGQPATSCADAAYKAALEKLNVRDTRDFSGALWMAMFSKVQFDRQSNKGNHIYQVSLPLGKDRNQDVSYFSRTRYEVVTEPASCNVLQITEEK